MKYRRIFTVVIDSLGIGAAADASLYGDEGSDTLGSIDAHMESFSIPHLASLGITKLHPLHKVPDPKEVLGYYGILSERSVGKDTMTGHWELMGLYIREPFLTFTESGFPSELIEELEKRTGKRVIGNRSASGTEIIEELGEEEIATGAMIVYTSADSVLQICGQEETFDLQNLYRCCEIARELTLKEEWKVGRVIARPYVGRKKGEFQRTSNRRDYALKPYGKTALDALKEAGLSVLSVGKINDIFDTQGITKAYKSKSSLHGMDQTISLQEEDFSGLCFTNLVDFDAKWGHRRDPIGYGRELEAFDKKLGLFLKNMKEEDLLIVTADHGNDPAFAGTDHTREKVPFLLYSPSMKGSGRLPDGDTFGVVGTTITDNFNISMPKGCIGYSVLKDLN